MLGRKNKKAPVRKGQGAAAAKQMGLFVDFSPEEMMDMEGNLDDPDLEAEFAAIVGKKQAGAGRPKAKAKAPLPMEHIEKMAVECMKDEDDDDSDEGLENDEDLLAELQEIVEDKEPDGEESTISVSTPETSPAETPESPQQQEVKVSAAPGNLQHTLEERIGMYKTAIANANASGESSKARRYDRGLKTLETMLSSVKKGKKIDEAEIPPPVALGAHSTAPALTVPKPVPPEPPVLSSDTGPMMDECPPDPEQLIQGAVEKSVESPGGGEGESTKARLLERQREYRVAAVKAKQVGDIEKAKEFMKTSKRFDALIEALDNGKPIDPSDIPSQPVVESKGSATSLSTTNIQKTEAPPPVPAAPAAPSQPSSVLEALEQRMAKYEEACAQAKESGNARKARMHERIAKQYQSTIRSYKAGRPVNFEELPIPPGFPPIPGQEKAGGGAEQGIVAVLEAANKLASDEGNESQDDDIKQVEPEGSKPSAPQKAKKPTLAVPPSVQAHKMASSPSPESCANSGGLPLKGQQQLEFLEERKKQYLKAAVQAKQNNDLEQARNFLRTAKGFDPMIEVAKSGKAVDLAKVPSPPGDEDGDFILVHHSDVQVSEKAEEVYSQLSKLLKEQYEKCLTYSKQFTHLGNISETTKFEKLAESCKKNLEILKLSQAQGLDPPKHRFEERTFKTVRIFPELSSTEMVVVIVKAMNLPAPQGIATNDLDAFVKFEFPYPSTEQPQKHKTAVIKNSNCPEYNQSFTLTINRNHRGFRRVIQSKGLKMEVLHKGGFLRSDKPLGAAHLKLDKLETQSEVREIVEVIEGRKPTGGLLEVRVRLREPLSGQDVQTTTERWLILDQSQVIL
ncbi:coiled-coil and C2 domain-containing protein 1B isoform X1 [Scleropages formosus]|uniref:Coiled-coil and C2 domain-containing protein 1B n=1 Tax=Scleropages formosus TaxID=113540 RepID=A0A8C9VSD7_SCLFO|nr:coiled-coil and C2 domain-containing protein 1B isoform X1 [Scleropages formosus]